MKTTTIIFSLFAAIAAVHAAPAPLEKRGVNPALVPDFGIQRGNCVGDHNILVPCACPPTRSEFSNVSSERECERGHMIHNPSIAAPFPSGNSKYSQQVRIATLLSTLQNLHGPGVGCPAVSPVYGDLQQKINALPN
ncbi:hypothetical protein BD309DRAFT_1019121 [Dichomitus squalens]|uniref:Uncharacterized protein n=1 Tax=Dichomitus squalens TaxID=114155 RepID=A0A4Q9NQ96_9APHY|nr:hypothetical protein BD309DRAFT_1019121 [Dichomitus squalens]TBU54867.1 hypothetical protein BD310DRAFT_980073 [Dichomitus squalens]